MINSLSPLNNSLPVTTPRIEELLESFISYQDIKKTSQSLYKRTLRLYFDWLKVKGYQLANLTGADVKAYKEHLLSSGMSSLTVSSYLNSVRRFYEWAEGQRLYPNIGRGIRSPKRKQPFKKRPLLPDQSTQLLTHLQRGGKRDYAIVNLLLRTGLRTVELIRADVGDISYRNGKRVLLVQGKGRDEKDNLVVLTDKAYQPIADYLATRGKVKAGDPLFTSDSNNSSGERLSTRTISYTVKEGLKEIGIDSRDFTAHSMRHSTATNILRAGGSIADAQAVLRHSSPATTQIYLSTILEEQRLNNPPEELIDNLF